MLSDLAVVCRWRDRSSAKPRGLGSGWIDGRAIRGSSAAGPWSRFRIDLSGQQRYGPAARPSPASEIVQALAVVLTAPPGPTRPATLSRPRSENPVKPRAALMMPKTGSTTCWRSLVQRILHGLPRCSSLAAMTLSHSALGFSVTGNLGPWPGGSRSAADGPATRSPAQSLNVALGKRRDLVAVGIAVVRPAPVAGQAEIGRDRRDVRHRLIAVAGAVGDSGAQAISREPRHPPRLERYSRAGRYSCCLLLRISWLSGSLRLLCSSARGNLRVGTASGACPWPGRCASRAPLKPWPRSPPARLSARALATEHSRRRRAAIQPIAQGLPACDLGLGSAWGSSSPSPSAAAARSIEIRDVQRLS